ncbi:hypothetical protein TSOC_007453 [Tetrabaena socialis]|uniref:Uncharacterized protein n=1 Tax=Tetrabaena socialis TaxID=47790 RepID=A0A2J8A0Z7_9CHLO|nr:hypothetical protein TSOC_007453 [Tetrabaena socialis]|eukprot:PNH06186.1 hypothetical protein TSOC_007453 [Tetrabaena socialis]
MWGGWVDVEALVVRVVLGEPAGAKQGRQSDNAIPATRRRSGGGNPSFAKGDNSTFPKGNNMSFARGGNSSSAKGGGGGGLEIGGRDADFVSGISVSASRRNASVHKRAAAKDPWQTK